MIENDRIYYRHRVEVEIECAQRATSPCVVLPHYEMAQAYLCRLASDTVDVEAP